MNMKTQERVLLDELEQRVIKLESEIFKLISALKDAGIL